MSGDDRPNLPRLTNIAPLPQTFAETVALLAAIALQTFAAAATEQQLYYHNEDHIRNVQRRSRQIFNTIYPALERESPGCDRTRMELLLDLCAVTHDWVQIFEPSTQAHATRWRKSGSSEQATIDLLLQQIDNLNQQLDYHPNHPAKLTDADIATLREAITATICVFDPVERSIYQPLLYQSERPIAIVPRILALADLGALGIDGIEEFNREGCLLFLEENPDVVPLLQNGSIHTLPQTHPSLAENIRLRLLKRANFQVNFAKSRLARLPKELEGFPRAIIPPLIEQIFCYLTPATIEVITTITPTHPETPLNVLLEFFQLDRCLASALTFGSQ